MSSLLTGRDYYRPHSHPWAFDAFKTMFDDLHWSADDIPMADDLRDWESKLTDDEREFLTQLFRFFTQADLDVSQGYAERYIPRFKTPEVRMMLLSFGAAEANHIHAYSLLMDTLGISEGEYKAFHDYKAMREKHEYMFARDTGSKSITDLVVDLAVFSAFGEGMQLFSSFALLMNFQRRNLMKGMSTVVEYSIRDETHHVESMLKLFHALIAEHPRVWNDDTKKRVYETCRAMVKLEDAFIDQAFGIGHIEGVTPPEAKQYIRYIADRRLMQLGLKKNYNVKNNPFEWLDTLTNIPTHTNFFEGRSTEYSKGEVPGWEHAFDFLGQA
jgi:ribonucleoside-diphosphate reductase beta chain